MTATATTIRVVDIIDSPIAVSTEKAQRVHTLLAKKLQAGEDVRLSFDGIETVITAFLNAALGQLYGAFSEDVITKHLEIVDAAPETQGMIERTVRNAKRYFANPELYRQAYRELEQLDAL